MRKRSKHSRRALSSVVVSMMLLSAVVTMGTGLVAWSHATLQSHTQTLSQFYTQRNDRMNENIVIEDVWFGTSPQKFMNITMHNNGPESINIVDIQIINSSQTLNLNYTYNPLLITKVNSTSIPYSWVSGTPYTIDVTTARNSMYQVLATP